MSANNVNLLELNDLGLWTGNGKTAGLVSNLP